MNVAKPLETPTPPLSLYIYIQNKNHISPSENTGWEVGLNRFWNQNNSDSDHDILLQIHQKWIFTESKKKKQDIVFRNRQLGGSNQSMEIMVEKLNRCNPKKMGYTF